MRAPRRHVILAWLIALVACLAFGHAAEAGRTGGSMGGGSWGSRTSSSSSSSYSHSYSSSSSGGGGSYGYYSSGGSGDSTGIEVGVAIIFFIVSVVIQAARTRARNASYDTDVPDFMPDTSFGTTYNPIAGNYADVTVLRIAVDGRARKFVQTELARIAKIADTATPEGRATMLREVALLLRRLRDAWVYGGAVNEQMREEGKQKAVFDRHVDDARVRFMAETIRNEQGLVTTAAPVPAPVSHGDPSQSLVLVTIVIAAHSELFEVKHIGTGDDLRQALESASHRTANDLIAIEIIWMPSAEDETLTSMDLVAKYPPPDLIPIQGALVGKVFCAYCSGPFPAELVSCPHCGAPAAGASDAPPATSAG